MKTNDSRKKCVSVSMTIFLCVPVLFYGARVPCAWAAPAAATQKAPAGAAAGAGQDVETLVNTLNEVLEENRKMRKELTESQGTLKKLNEENGILRSQVQRLKTRETENGQEDKDRLKKATKEVKELQQHIDELSAENEKLGKLKKEYEARIPELESKTKQLEGVLDHALLEGERDQYLKLIESAQEMTNRTFVELAASKDYMLTLESQMKDAYFKLGNMLYDLKDFQNAIASYGKVLDIDPSDAWTHHNLAVIYDYYVHDDKQAIYHYEQYLQVKPVEEEAKAIRERILEMKLKKNMVPPSPIEQEFYEDYTKVPR